MRRVVAYVLAASVLAAMPASAEVLCRSKTGRVFARATCKKREKSVELPLGPTGDPGTTPAPIRVVDSAGLQVGLIVEAGNEDYGAAVVFEVGTRLVSFGISALGIGGGTEFAHLVADCSDPPLIVQSHDAFVRTAVVMGTTAYYAEDPIETKTVVRREYKPPSGTCSPGDTTMANGNCCALSGGTADVGPATTAFDLSTFTPPFHLEQ